jgi:flavin-dependent dehydrogenase
MATFDPTRDRQHHDAVVIGGGPAGSITARQLAAAGYDVLVLEREEFPRFHIGESQLPYTAGILERLGILDLFPAEDFPTKWGAEFTGPSGDFRRVDFTTQGGGRREAAFQCERAKFDDILLRNAEQLGAQVLHGARVTEVLESDGRIRGVRYRHGDSEYEAYGTFVLDASGRAGVLAHRYFKNRRPNTRLELVGYFKHFGDVDEATNPGIEGDIQVGHHPDGWLWAIPIGHGKLSVGAVTPAHRARGASPAAVFDEHIARVPRVKCRVEGATVLEDVRGESDYCYFSNTLAGDGYFSVGDAGCFVDPIFSAGVYLAITSAVRAADSVIAILRGADERETQRDYENFVKTGYDCYTRLIYAFYDSEFNFGRYVASLANSSVTIEGRWIARLLSGDFWSRNNPVGELLRNNREYDTFDPFPFVYGCPVYPEQDAAESNEAAVVG